MYGPLVIGDTTRPRGVFRLIPALRYIRTWGETVYYPWLRDEILLPLAGEESQAGPASPEAHEDTDAPTEKMTTSPATRGNRGGGRGRGGRGKRGGKTRGKGKARA